jgi:hypothetical protein
MGWGWCSLCGGVERRILIELFAVDEGSWRVLV